MENTSLKYYLDMFKIPWLVTLCKVVLEFLCPEIFSPPNLWWKVIFFFNSKLKYKNSQLKSANLTLRALSG